MAVIFQPSAIMPPQVKALMKRSLRVNRRRKLNLFQLERAVSLHTWRSFRKYVRSLERLE